MRPETIVDALRNAGATIEGETPASTAGNITKQNLVELGLSGGRDSAAKRRWLMKKLELPEHMSSNALLQALNLLMDLETLETVLAGENND